uniref:Uncharacterized protein n=1 Tax=Physcomitrium patens TaxID=3218 RepID=A0A2K1KKH6_PHYPA|nr:hypothetical protein PHYPA_007954 [Physcomitrium patens]
MSCKIALEDVHWSVWLIFGVAAYAWHFLFTERACTSNYPNASPCAPLPTPPLNLQRCEVYQKMEATSLLRSWWVGEATNSSPLDGGTKPGDIEKTSGVYKLSKPKPPRKVEVEIVFIYGLQLYEHSNTYWTTWIGGKGCKEFVGQ